MYQYNITLILKDETKRAEVNFFNHVTQIRYAEREYNERFENVKKTKRINVIIKSNFLHVTLFSSNELRSCYAPCSLQYFSEILADAEFAEFCINTTPRRLLTSIMS